ncbi:hypothetical protein PG993_012199 [Apiospora rasikravindrae]|uniref:Uncharacterized protein n=1 Tax=Apiospora rasikravindrae TaxID=990691 RepID=A0ABR1S1Y0_9PEZI
MKQSRDIRGFFAKNPAGGAAPTTISETSTPPRTKAVPMQPTSSSPDVPSSPITPQRARTKVPLSRDDVIRGSDDEDSGDSDDSLESLSEIAARQRKPGQAPLPSTMPKAKRVASGTSRAAPVVQTQPQKHKYDLKALLKHAREDDAADESVRRAEALLKQDHANRKVTEAPKGEDEPHPTNMREVAKELLHGDEEGSKGDKLVRAMNRTTGDASQLHYYFFEFEAPSRDVRRTPFPRLAAKKQWSFLADTSTREETFVRGLPTALASKGKELPPELYQWILDEVCLEKNMQLRMQYCNLITLCRENTRRLVDVKRLQHILESIGSRKFPDENSQWHSSPGLGQPYGERNWSPVSTFLKLLERMAPNLAPESMIGAVQILIRMSLDPIISRDIRIRIDHFSTIEALVSALPGTGEQWNSYCNQICLYLHGGVGKTSQRQIAISLLPPSTPRLCELRRRLAAAALFQRPSLSSSYPDDALTRKDILARLDAPDFLVTHETDYEELQANVKLLNMVMDDGSFLRSPNASRSSTPATPATPSRTPNQILPSAATIAGGRLTITQPRSNGGLIDTSAGDFDQFIDTLTRKLKIIHDTISDNSLVSRKEVKADIDTVGKRLAHTVRTRPPPKTSIIDDLIGHTKRDEDAGKPRQREFMKKWALQKKHDVDVNDDSDV